ncbi:hypothetical protein ACFVH7_42025 [Kitasatospora indigofera]|uniref:hypothetical protein n=1 Tax=Kitasatospora indigofera TaxID=67307 RepID=UPI00362D4978
MNPDVTERLTKHTGPLTDTALITDRRGVQVWRVTAGGGPDAEPGQRLAVKIPADHDPAPTREIAVLRALADQTGTTRSPLIDGDGFTAGPWFDGPSTMTLFKPARTSTLPSPSEQAALLAGASDFCHAVGELHRLGWVHTDLQPAHCIHTDHGARLIDLAGAQGPRPLTDPALNTPYNGALAHLEAPELARSLTTDTPAHPTYASDVYALAASLWTAATGHWPLNYPAAGVNPHSATLTELRTAIGTGHIPLHTAPPALSVLCDTLRPALDPDPASRPRAAELAQALQAPYQALQSVPPTGGS